MEFYHKTSEILLYLLTLFPTSLLVLELLPMKMSQLIRMNLNQKVAIRQYRLNLQV